MNAIIVSLLLPLVGQCGPEGRQLPSSAIFSPAFAFPPPIVYPPVAEEYQMSDINGKKFVHTNPNFLRKWIEERNSNIIRARAKELSDKKASLDALQASLVKKEDDIKKSEPAKKNVPPQDNVPPAMNFGVKIQSLQNSMEGLKTNDPVIAREILPEKEVPIPDQNTPTLRVDYVATAALIAAAIAVVLFGIGLSIK